MHRVGLGSVAHVSEAYAAPIITVLKMDVAYTYGRLTTQSKIVRCQIEDQNLHYQLTNVRALSLY